MAIDLDAIKKRLAQLNGSGSSAKNVWWRPKKVGEYRIRIVPWQDNAKQPFKEVWYYKNIGRKAPGSKYGPFPMPTLAQFKKPDPIQEIIDSLRKEGEEDEKKKDENKDLLKRLYPKLTVVVPIIVRGEEAEGVKLWAITDIKMIYQKLLGYFVDPEVLEDTADYTSVVSGFDLKVNLIDKGRKWQGKTVLEWDITTAKKVSPLSNDAAQTEKWLSSIPNLAEIDPVPTYDEMKKRLEEWFEDGAGTNTATDSSEGTEHASGTDDKLNAAEDLKSEATEKPAPKAEAKAEAKTEKAEKPAPAEEKPEPAKKARKKAGAEEASQDLDQMLQELGSDD